MADGVKRTEENAPAGTRASAGVGEVKIARWADAEKKRIFYSKWAFERAGVRPARGAGASFKRRSTKLKKVL